MCAVSCKGRMRSTPSPLAAPGSTASNATLFCAASSETMRTSSAELHGADRAGRPAPPAWRQRHDAARAIARARAARPRDAERSPPTPRGSPRHRRDRPRSSHARQGRTPAQRSAARPPSGGAGSMQRAARAAASANGKERARALAAPPNSTKIVLISHLLMVRTSQDAAAGEPAMRAAFCAGSSQRRCAPNSIGPLDACICCAALPRVAERCRSLISAPFTPRIALSA